MLFRRLLRSTCGSRSMRTARPTQRPHSSRSARLAGPHFAGHGPRLVHWGKAIPSVRLHAVPRWIVNRSLPGAARRRPVAFRVGRYPEPLPWREEVVNAILHGLGAIVGLLAGAQLVSRAVATGEMWLAVGLAVYTATLVATLGCSFASHLIHQPHWRHLFRVLDQACIFLLIAGTCTPFFLRYLMTDTWWWMLPAMWAVAVAGFRSKLLGSRINGISVATYLALGWFPMIALPIWLAHFPPMCWALVGAGGLSYTAGTWFLMNDHRWPFFHAVWHTSVLVGVACIQTAMALYVV